LAGFATMSRSSTAASSSAFRCWNTRTVEANWETMRVHRHSSSDADGLAALANDPRRSNEERFAFLEGLRRLTELDTSGRVAAQPITVET